MKRCNNCHSPIPDEALYCLRCGQKDTDGRISLGRFIAELIDSAFNLNSKFFQTLRYIFVPGRLTREYFKGKHRTYTHPLRLFFVLAVLHLAHIGFVANKYMKLDGSPLTNMERKVAQLELLDKADEYADQLSSEEQRTSLKTILDSLGREFRSAGNTTIDTSTMMGVLTLDRDSMILKPLQVSIVDVTKLSYDELIEKYGITDYFTKVSLKQTIKATKEPKAFILSGIGNLVWMMFIMLPIMAFIMKVLYIRGGYYFIEHLVFLFHWHAVGFIMMSLFLFLAPGINKGFGALFILAILVFGFLGIRRYYQQGFFVSLLKFIIICISYSFILGFFLGLTAVVSFFIT